MVHIVNLTCGLFKMFGNKHQINIKIQFGVIVIVVMIGNANGSIGVQHFIPVLQRVIF